MPQIDAHTWEMSQDEALAYGLFNDLLNDGWSCVAAMKAITMVYDLDDAFVAWLTN